jgi:hypothetical protein
MTKRKKTNNDAQNTQKQNLSWYWLSCLGSLVYLHPETFIWLSNILNIDATDEGFSRNASRALNNTSTFLFKTLTNEDIIIRSFIKGKLFIALGLLQVNFV